MIGRPASSLRGVPGTSQVLSKGGRARAETQRAASPPHSRVWPWRSERRRLLAAGVGFLNMTAAEIAETAIAALITLGRVWMISWPFLVRELRHRQQAVSGAWREKTHFTRRRDDSHLVEDDTRTLLRVHGRPDSTVVVPRRDRWRDAFVAEKPRLWSEGRYQTRGGARMFDLAPDGTRFALVTQRFSPRPDHAVFVFNFLDEWCGACSPTAP